MQFRAMMIMVLLGSLDLAYSKKTHKSKTYKKGHKKAGHKLVPSLSKKDVAEPQNQLEIQKEPVTLPATALAHLTDVLPMINGVNNGRHTMKQIMQEFDQRGMTSAQIKAVFNTIDKDKSGDVTDTEWTEFFDLFYSKFVVCDADADNVLNDAEMLTCLTDLTGQLLNLSAFTAAEVTSMKTLMDVETSFNFYDYIFVRRVNNAITNCGDNRIIQPQKLYCALSITSPRTRHIFSPEERQIYLAGIVLIDGFYYGQVSYLNPLQLMGTAYIYNYFSDYELPYNDGIVEKVDFIRSVQDGMLPYIYNPLVVEMIFTDMDSMDFYALAQSVFGFRTFLKNSDPDATNPLLKTMNLAKFQALVLTYPARLQTVITNSDVPTQVEIETASQQYWLINPVSDDTFLRNFNNLIFMEKAHKVKQVPAAVNTAAAALAFVPGDTLFFNIMNSATNGFINLDAYLRYFRFSSMYLEFDPYAKQMLSYEQISKKRKPLTLQSVCAYDRFLFDQMVDYLAGKPEFFLNYKEFIEWMMLDKVFATLKNTGHSQTTGLDRVVVGFHFLGLRLSKYALSASTKKFDAQMNESSVIFRQTFIIALTEEIQSQRTLLRDGLVANAARRRR